MRKSDRIQIPANRVVRGDLIELDGETFVVQRVEGMRNNMRFTPPGRNARPVLRGKRIKVWVTRDLAFYYRSSNIDAETRAFAATTTNKSYDTRSGRSWSRRHAA